MSELPDSTTVLIDDDGNEIVFDFLDDIEYGDDEYVVLTPQDEEDDSVVILRVIRDEDDNEILESIEDDALVEELFDVFRETNQDLYDFE